MDEERIKAEDRETEILRIAEKILDKVPEVDNIVVVMQYKRGGYVWYAPDGSTVAETNWLLDTLKHYLLDAKVP